MKLTQRAWDGAAYRDVGEQHAMYRPPPVPAVHNWRNNAELIADVARLGYLLDPVLDTTFGMGRWWTIWQPYRLVAADLRGGYTAMGFAVRVVDFRHMPWSDSLFDSVCFDPPYRMSGTPDRGFFDTRYGIEEPISWQERLENMRLGLRECIRVCKPRGFILAKMQDQVVSGKMVWQTDELTQVATECGATKVDRFDMVTPVRAQPPGRTQVHARHNASQLLIFRKGA